MLTLSVRAQRWAMKEPFAISRGVQTDQPTIVVEVNDAQGYRGRGEACGIPYEGDTPETLMGQIEAQRSALEHCMDRHRLREILPAGGARCAIDSALWDLEAKRKGQRAWSLAGLTAMAPVATACTIGIRSLPGYTRKGRELSSFSVLKVKVGKDDPVSAVRAVRAGAPDSRLIVDPNQSWTIDQLKTLATEMAALGVVLLEQPIRVGEEDGLRGYRCPVPLCADELIRDQLDLGKAAGIFDVINIKLDKTGGLTEALDLANAAERAGFQLMVGCMAGSSLSMAPALILAQRCAFVDLDGPLLQAEDWPDGLLYRDGVIYPPSPDFWG